MIQVWRAFKGFGRQALIRFYDLKRRKSSFRGRDLTSEKINRKSGCESLSSPQRGMRDRMSVFGDAAENHPGDPKVFQDDSEDHLHFLLGAGLSIPETVPETNAL